MRTILTLVCAAACFQLAAIGEPESISTAPIYINQAGYRTEGVKYFITDEAAEAFTVINEKGDVVLEESIKLHVKDDPDTGKTTYIGDFSSVKESGEYTIVLSDRRKSPAFKIAPDIYNDAAKKTIQAFYFQRCGIPLEENYAGQFQRDVCHDMDSHYHPSTAFDGKVGMTGGWHDAGDYGRYIHSASVSLGHMMTMYEQHPEKFNYDDNNIPESGNGISDFIDEIIYELDWMLNMQVTDNSSDLFGGVHYMLNTKRYTWSAADWDGAKRFVYQVSSVATADFAAAMAQASRLLSTVKGQQDRAQKYLHAAENAWTFLQNKPNLYPSNGFARPSDTETGGYAESADMDDSDDRLWAAVELYLTTGQSEYHEAALADKLFANPEHFDYNMSWENVRAFPMFNYMLAKKDGLNSELQAKLKELFLDRVDTMLDQIEADGFKDALTSYYWGCSGGVAALAHYLVEAYEMTGNEAYLNGAESQLHYLLGINGHNMSFVSKVGYMYPQNIHHAALASDDIDDIYPGVVAGGPNPDLNADYTLPTYFTNSTPPALCYVDHIDSWASNENCLLYNAPVAALAAYFSNFN